VKLPKKSKFFRNLSWEIEFVYEITWKKSKFFGNLPWKIDFFVKLPEKHRNFFEMFLENLNFLWNCLKNQNSSQNLPCKIEIFCEITWKNLNFSKICPENRFFCLWNCLKKSTFFWNFSRKSKIFDPDPRPPDFKPDWRRCYTVSLNCTYYWYGILL